MLLHYENFGPEDLAQDLLGPKQASWAQAELRAGNDLGVDPTIKVVIFRGVELTTIQEKFPVDKNRQEDFRYIEYHQAMQWFNKNIQTLNDDLASGKGDKDIAFYFLRKLYREALKIERALRQ